MLTARRSRQISYNRKRVTRRRREARARGDLRRRADVAAVQRLVNAHADKDSCSTGQELALVPAF